MLFVLLSGQKFWPEGLPAHSQNVFWLASGVNLAGLLLLGMRYWPVILLDAFPAHWIAGEPLDLTLLGSGTNAMEALLAAWMIHRWGAWANRFDRLRPSGILLLASLVAPLVNTVVIPAWFCLRGAMPWDHYGRALGNWNLANGTAMLMVTPPLLSLLGGEILSRERWKELAGVLVACAAISTVAFGALFSGVGLNLAFIVFPVIMYASVRLGARELSAAFIVVLVAVYGALAWNARAMPGPQMASAIWFVQAFCWVLAGTGLLVAGLEAERQEAETRTLAEQGRTLEASLREERARLEALRYQINPHFLFNALNSIRATLPLSQNVTREMVTSLSDYFRTTLTDPGAETASLRDEIASVEHYLAIEKRRFEDELQVFIAMAPEVAGKRIPVFLIQPLVENAVHHGFSTSPDRLELTLTATASGGNLLIEIANSGTWKEPGAGEGTGIGLDNIRRRLNLMYGEAAHLQIASTPGWVRATITLPLEEEP